MLEIAPASHPLLDAGLLAVRLPAPLSALPSPEWLTACLRPEADVPLRADDAVRAAVRDLLRHGGFKPTGRSKPSSEYLLRAAAEATLATINALVDVGNAVSLHSGLPVSVVDLERCTPPLALGVAGPGASYVFNASGQTIDLEGLLCLFDAAGPCANAVKDAQRTKTHAGTKHALFVLWGTRQLAGRTAATAAWCGELLTRLGATHERGG